jgi:predicted PurR-regulated permease PerM
MPIKVSSVPDSVAKEDTISIHRPSLEDTARLFEGPLGIRSLSLSGLFVLACFYTLYLAREFFLPVTLAVVLMFLLTPLIRVLKRVRIPEAMGAAIVILAVSVVAGFLAFELSSPLAEWLDKAPEIGAKLQAKAQPLKRYFTKVSNTSEQVERLTSTSVATKDSSRQVELKKTSLLDNVLSGTSKVVFSLLVVVVLLYFLLASGDLFLSKLVHVLPTLSDKKKAVHIAREIEENISKYLSTIAMINVGIGVFSGLLFWAFVLPNPALWGALAGLLNFIPTVGALSVAILIALVSIASFSSLTRAALVPAAFLAVTVTMGTFVSPLIMGRRLTLNPVVIFIGLSFWGWLWGLPGALLAVPMLAMFKIFCDHIEPLAPIGEFLGH